MAKWRKIKCAGCDGHGMVCDYGPFGMDFDGPDECDDCSGTGVNYFSKTGALVKFVGGPFIGRLSKAEIAKAKDPTHA